MSFLFLNASGVMRVSATLLFFDFEAFPLTAKCDYLLGKGSKKCGFIHIWVGGWFSMGTKSTKNMPLKWDGGWVRPSQPALESDFFVSSLRI